MSSPLISVIVSSKNGARWLPDCFASVRAQTVFDRLEVIFVDGLSTDGAPDVARRELAAFPLATVVEPEKDLGFTGGNNLGATMAKGELFFILNDDTRMEPDCLEKLLRAMDEAGADAAVPEIAEYGTRRIVPSAPMGFDIFGRMSWAENEHDLPGDWHECFMIVGAGFVMSRRAWETIGGFDEKHFINGDDDDVSWKFWLAGFRGIFVRTALLQHRTHRPWEIKEFHRYLVNRNTLMVAAKNAQHILLVCVLTQSLMIFAEGVLLLLITRRWRFVWNCYFKAVGDCAGMWRHILEKRKINRRIRRRSDWTMIRKFFRLRPNRWDVVKAFFIHGRRPAVKPAD